MHSHHTALGHTTERSYTKENINIPGNLFVISAPSGAGKSSLVNALMTQEMDLTLSISHTTRDPRGQEKNGTHYWFVSTDEFKHMIERGDFIEWAQVHDNFYGTSRHEIFQRLKEGRDIILEIDWQGAIQIRETFAKAVLIFILPPSWQELENRLAKRGEDSPKTINKRLENAHIELSKAKAFDFVIINSLFDTALEDLKSIIRSQRLCYSSQQHHNSQIFEALGI